MDMEQDVVDHIPNFICQHSECQTAAFRVLLARQPDLFERSDRLGTLKNPSPSSVQPEIEPEINCCFEAQSRNLLYQICCCGSCSNGLALRPVIGLTELNGRASLATSLLLHDFAIWKEARRLSESTYNHNRLKTQG